MSRSPIGSLFIRPFGFVGFLLFLALPALTFFPFGLRLTCFRGDTGLDLLFCKQLVPGFLNHL